MKLTGHESSVLAFLAQRPSQLEEFRSSLGKDALLVARYLAGELKSPPTAAKETGDAIVAWANEREVREAKERLASVLF